MDEIRRKKLEEQLREELSALIVGGEVKDPRVGPFTSITRVEAASDLSVAKVFVSVFDLETAAEASAGAGEAGAPSAGSAHADAAPQRDRLSEAVAGLGAAAGFLQARLAKRIRTRLTPRLHFVADRGVRAGFEMNEKIKGLFS